MKTPEQIKETRIKNINGHQENATERGIEVAQNCLHWVGRWGYVSGPSLARFVAARFNTKRPFIASEMVKRGLLEAVKIPYDQREKVGGLMKIYRVSKATCQADKSLPAYRKNPPYLDNFLHALAIQNFVAEMVNPNPLSTDWLTEYECKIEHRERWKIAAERRHIPIPDAIILRGESEIWIEIEATPKRGIRRDLMATQYENLFSKHDAKGYFGKPIEGVVIVAPNEKVMQSYQQKSFDAEALQPASRDAKERRYSREKSSREINPSRTFAGRIWLTYFDEESGKYPGLEPGLIWHGHPDIEPVQDEPQDDKSDAESIAKAKELLEEFEAEHPWYYEQYTVEQMQTWAKLCWNTKESEASDIRFMVSMWNAAHQFEDPRPRMSDDFINWLNRLP